MTLRRSGGKRRGAEAAMPSSSLTRFPWRDPVSLELVEAIAEGLDVADLHALAVRLAPDDRTLIYRIVPKATLARRERQGTLTAAESARVARLSYMMDAAVSAMRTEAAARAFVFQEHQMLRGRAPFQVAMMNEFGGKVVRDIICSVRQAAGDSRPRPEGGT